MKSDVSESHVDSLQPAAHNVPPPHSALQFTPSLRQAVLQLHNVAFWKFALKRCFAKQLRLSQTSLQNRKE